MVGINRLPHVTNADLHREMAALGDIIREKIDDKGRR